MRVVCQTIDEFLLCLKEEKAVVQNAVRVSISERPVDKGARDSIKYEIVLQAAAVVQIDEYSQYLLEVGIDCGVDVRDSDPSMEASIKARNLKQKIEDFCKGRELKVLPGMIHL